MELDVLLPFHRLDSFFEEAIKSLLATQGVTFRTILIDDRIDRNNVLPTLIRDLKHFEVVRTKGGEGYGAALKVGSALIQSDAVALFNSDDLIHSSRFFKQLSGLEDSEICLTNMRRIGANGKFTSSITGSLDASIYNPIYLLFGAYGANATWCMRKDWWLQNAFFDNLESLDWRIALETFMGTDIFYINENLYFYRKHQNQVTWNKNPLEIERSVVFNSWEKLCYQFEINNINRNVFDFFATPWLIPDSILLNDQVKFVSELKGAISNMPNVIQNQVMKLVARRFLLGIRSKNISLSTRLKFLEKGIIDLPNFSADLINSFLN
jgi:glycosyltransferase involved in cell wall biosynthesis